MEVICEKFGVVLFFILVVVFGNEMKRFFIRLVCLWMEWMVRDCLYKWSDGNGNEYGGVVCRLCSVCR